MARSVVDKSRRRGRRRLLQLAASATGSAFLAGFARAQGVQALYRDRPPLPGMGPSLREDVDYGGPYAAGTIEIDTKAAALTLVLGAGRAFRYRISVGREGFGWSGTVLVGAKKSWPEWRPPAEMRKRVAGLPEFVPPGPYNPLGARALYLHRNGRDTLYRIHGTNDPEGVGFDGTSGCFRLTNTDVIDLSERVAIGTKVIVV